MSKFFNRTNSLTALVAVLFTPFAFAHVTLETRQAPIDSTYTAVLLVHHGCSGSPTVKLRVRVPEGVVDVQPQPTEGWTVETVEGDYATSYTFNDVEVSSGVQEIVWSGGPLPDDQRGEFVFLSHLSSDLVPGTMLHFPVVQECEQGVARWIDVPEPGQELAADDHSHDHDHDHGHGHGHDRSDSPAPGLRLLSKS